MSAAPKRILVVDDQEDCRLILNTILKKHNYEVILAENPIEALQMLKKTPPDLIISDVIMPEMDGYTFCQILQNYSTLSDIPVIFHSNLGQEKERKKAFQVGAVAFLQRPVPPKELVEQVQKHIQSRKSFTVAKKDLQLKRKTMTLQAQALTVTGKPGQSLEHFKNQLSERLKLSIQEIKDLSYLTGHKLYDFVSQRGMDADTLARSMAFFLGMNYMEHINTNDLKVGLFPTSFMKLNMVIPIEQNGFLKMIVAHPFDLELRDLLNQYSKQFIVASPNSILQLLEAPEENAPPLVEYSQGTLMDVTEELSNLYDSPESDSPEVINEQVITEDSPFISRLVNQMIEQAASLNASDIHIEPQEHSVLIRVRVDGHLQELNEITPQKIIHPLISRLKIMGDLDIAQKRLPQDGRIVYKKFNQKQLDIDLRVSTVPTQFGESCVMRLIQKQGRSIGFEGLGFSQKSLKLYKESLLHSYGMILNVGPTGSGKTTTLYEALNHLNQSDRKILTVEDPIEYNIEGIVQVETKPEIGLTFQRALRAFLRQDPDIILLGEIRDLETAKIAIEASLTGHLVLSTMHTNDAASTITRFMELGIPPFMVSASLTMVCAQRLVRRLCDLCKIPYEADNLLKQRLKQDVSHTLTLYKPGGCDQCRNKGYKGRVGIHEILKPNSGFKDLLSKGNITTEMVDHYAQAKCNMTPLSQDAMEKVVQGLTALEEVQSYLMNA